MGVKVREKVKGSGEWWVFINHQGRRKAKRVGVGRSGKKAAELAALKISARLAGGRYRPARPAERPDSRRGGADIQGVRRAVA